MIRKRPSPYFMLTIALAAIILTIIFTSKVEEGCDTVKTLFTSINIKSADGYQHVGFDLNKHNLTFGTLSPGGVSERTVSTGYTKNATLHVWAEGDFSSWVTITPKKLEIGPGQNKDVKFAAHVPLLVKEGEYTGTVFFCYQDKE